MKNKLNFDVLSFFIGLISYTAVSSLARLIFGYSIFELLLNLFN